MIGKTLAALALASTAALGANGALRAQTQPRSAQPRTASRSIAGDTTPMRGMQGDSMMAMMRRCPMMSAMAGGPDAALAQRTALKLSDTQVQRLEALRGSVQRTRTATMAQMPALQQTITQATNAQPLNEQGIRTALDRMAALHGDMVIAMLRAHQATQGILTAQQREQLASTARPGMMGMRGMSRGMNAMQGMNGMSGMNMMGMMQMMSGGMMDSTSTGCPMMSGQSMSGRSMPGMPMHQRDSARTSHVPR